MNIIEKLKDKTLAQPFGLCSDEEQAMLKKVGKTNCVCWQDSWVWADVETGFFPKITYAIRHGYQPEPEPDIIERLKNKSQAVWFKNRTKVEQEVFRKAGKENCRAWLNLRGWADCEGICEFISNTKYILKSSYQPEPEFIDIELVLSGHFWVLKESMPNCRHNSLVYASSHQQFVHFRTDLGGTSIQIAMACSWANEGEKVVARFRKETT